MRRVILLTKAGKVRAFSSLKKMLEKNPDLSPYANYRNVGDELRAGEVYEDGFKGDGFKIERINVE